MTQGSYAGIAALLLVLAGCGGGVEPSAPAAAPPTPAATAASDAVDQHGDRACVLVAEAVAADSLTKPGVVAAIADAGAKSTTASVVSSAAVLPVKRDRAIVAQGEVDEAIEDAELSSAAQEMLAACARANLG